MYAFTRTILVAALLLPAPVLLAQTTADPAGHWQGTLQVPDSPVSFEVDLAKDAGGALAGTLTVPSQQLKGLPLIKVAPKGNSINFQARSDQSFDGVVSADGASISGQYSIGGAAIPFTMIRAGEAKLEAPPKSAAIAKELEGTWNGTLSVDATALRLVLIMSNQPDGTAIGRIINVDQGGLQVPVVIKQDGSALTVESRVTAGSFTGRMNTSGTELVGTYTQGPLSSPLTFKRQP